MWHSFNFSVFLKILKANCWRPGEEWIWTTDCLQQISEFSLMVYAYIDFDKMISNHLKWALCHSHCFLEELGICLFCKGNRIISLSSSAGVFDKDLCSIYSIALTVILSSKQQGPKYMLQPKKSSIIFFPISLLCLCFFSRISVCPTLSYKE